MPRRPRVQFPGAFYHVHNRGVNRQSIVFDDADRKTFMSLLSQVVQKFDVRLICYCLMTTHFHLFLQTLEANLSEAMWFLLKHFANALNERHGRVGHVFQGRYKSRPVQTERYALVLARYIHRNPVKAAMVGSPEDYPWSSYPCYVGKLPKWEWLDTEWLLKMFHHDPSQARVLLQEFHQLESPNDEYRVLDSTRQFVLGGPEFKQEFSSRRAHSAS